VAKDIAVEWLSKAEKPGAPGEYQSVGASAPKDSPNLYAKSFTTSYATLEELWNWYAQKCGIDKKYHEKELHVMSGESKVGSFVLVERLQGDKCSESVFGLRTNDYTVSVTLRSAMGGKSVAGTLIVSVSAATKESGPRSLADEAAYLTAKSGKSGWVSEEVILIRDGGKVKAKAHLTMTFAAAKGEASGPVMFGWRSQDIGNGMAGGEDFELVEKDGKRSIKIKNRFSRKVLFVLDYSSTSDKLTVKDGMLKAGVWGAYDYAVDLTKATAFRPGQ
jgi:hypothetical protein